MGLSIILMKQVIIMFLLLLVGYILYKIRIVDDIGKKQITNIVLYVVTPSLIINTYQMDYDPFTAKNIVFGLLLSALALILAILVSYIVRIKAHDASLATERFAMVFGNCGFMGIPLINAVFGETGVLYCTTYVTMFNLFCWTFGVILMEKSKESTKKTLWERLKPLCTITIFAIIAGLIMYFAQIKLPDTINTTLEYIASMNTPLAMIVSGIYIAQSELLAALKGLRVYFLAFIKCLLIPALFVIILLVLPLDLTLKLTILICAACPTAANTMLFANRFGGDEKIASHIFTVTTLLSVVTIPLIVLMATYLL